MLKPTKILVPTDFSSYSDTALRQAFDIAKQYKAQVYVVHVIHGKNPYDTSDSTIPSYYENMEKQMIEGARKKLQQEVDKFPQTKELEVFYPGGERKHLRSHPGRREGQGDRPHSHSFPRQNRHCKISHRQCGQECPERGKVSSVVDKIRKGIGFRVLHAMFS
jgi:hypothetical protein